MEYVKNKKLGGAMIWAIDLDDYLGACGQKWPLLSTMNHQLKREWKWRHLITRIRVFFVAFGTELGLEVDNEIIEVSGPIFGEDNKKAEPSEVEATDNDLSEDVEDVEILTPNFDCPAAGFYPSPTNCGQYYQCTADKTVYRGITLVILIGSISALCFYVR